MGSSPVLTATKRLCPTGLQEIWSHLLHLEIEERWLDETQSAALACRLQSLRQIAKTKRAIAKG